MPPGTANSAGQFGLGKSLSDAASGWEDGLQGGRWRESMPFYHFA